ncbi:DUF4440 domain-containing protein [Alkalihalobacillus macyae]|uniref:nuclear transport factor 2 family protein n=1 Tax=Guptibacillus hwajinpoensis TaxID=208199 RepID=UPI00273B0771|nr:DUF4440 domain-containing protein [Alkalihalobacillus macyae]MDP4549794.1 DUF4440 domain-containing protein [Alkalihalobacillus macyae]
MEDQLEFKKRILDLELQLLKPRIRQSPTEIDKLLAEEFFEFGSSGAVWSKEDSVGGQGLSVRDMTLTNFEINLLAEGVVLATYHVKDLTRNQNTLRSSIWKLDSGHWKMFFHQGTLTES